MTKTTKEMIEVMKAYEEGKEIEFCIKNLIDSEWMTSTYPTWNWGECDYRVKEEPKEEPKYRPYKDIDELFKDWAEKTHSIPENMEKLVRPLIWVKSKDNETERLITDYDRQFELLETAQTVISLECLFEGYTFLDGSPCGKKE